MHRHQKTKKHDEIRNTKEDNDWVKTVKEKKTIDVLYSQPTSIGIHHIFFV